MSRYEYTIGKELDLKKEQEKTLSTPSLKSNLILKMMYLTFDILYGKEPTLPKVKVLEILARYPYWAWENGGYHMFSSVYAVTGKVLSASKMESQSLIDLGRDAQDNEQMHMMLVEDILHQKGIKLGWLQHRLIPRVMAFVYYYLTRIIFFIKPEWSFAMNAAFESHAEHEYMKMAVSHPEWDSESVESVHFDKYPRQKSLADLLRRIALDERDHMNHSLEEVERLQKKN